MRHTLFCIKAQTYFQDFSDGSAFLYRKKGEQFFSRYNTLTNTGEITPIEHLESGKFRSSTKSSLFCE